MRRIIFFKRKGLLSAILALTLLFSAGCAKFTGEVSSLLAPPAMSVGREALTKAIKAAVGENYELIYPQAGSYRTGIISADLNGDNVREAICFYRAGGERLGFLVMESREGEWVQLTRGESDAASLGRVAFGDLNGDGVCELVIGWQYLTDSDGSYNVYSISTREAVSLFTGLYTRFVMLQSAGGDRLVVLYRNSATRIVTASLVGQAEGEIGLINTVAMDSRTAAYVSVEAGVTAAGRPAVYADGQLEETGQYSTEVLVLNEQGRLTNELLTQLNAQTLRYTAVMCRDIDGDGVHEVPIERRLPAYRRHGADENLYLIEWNRFNGHDLTPVSRAFIDVTEKFSVTYPDEWGGNVTVERQEDNDRAFVFKTVEGAELFEIRVFGSAEYNDEQAGAGWQRLFSDSDRVYTVRCAAGNPLNVTFAQVNQWFTVIS